MPILAEEPSLFPDNLLDAVDQPAQVLDPAAERSWWAIYTRSRQEKGLARQLLGYQVPFYLPLIPKDHLIRGRRVRAYVPLFDGYVFLFGNPDERTLALTTNRIARVLPVPRQDKMWQDLLQVRQVIASGQPLTVEKRLLTGQRVRIRKGLLAGLEGHIIRREGTDRLLVAVEFMQKGVSVEINDCGVEPVSVPVEPGQRFHG